VGERVKQHMKYNLVRKPGAGKPPARFDERGVETEHGGASEAPKTKGPETDMPSLNHRATPRLYCLGKMPSLQRSGLPGRSTYQENYECPLCPPGAEVRTPRPRLGRRKFAASLGPIPGFLTLTTACSRHRGQETSLPASRHAKQLPVARVLNQGLRRRTQERIVLTKPEECVGVQE